MAKLALIHGVRVPWARCTGHPWRGRGRAHPLAAPPPPSLCQGGGACLVRLSAQRRPSSRRLGCVRYLVGRRGSVSGVCLLRTWASRYGEMWGDVGRCGEISRIWLRDMGRSGEIWGDIPHLASRYGEIWGDMGRYPASGPPAQPTPDRREPVDVGLLVMPFGAQR